MKKFLNWLFRKDLELNKRLWHRLVKVGYFLITGLIVTGLIIAIFVETENSFFLNHNVKKTTLNSYSKNYEGNDTDNTLYRFVVSGSDFGIVDGDRIVQKYLYLSLDTFEEPSFCYKEPAKNLEKIMESFIQDFNRKNEHIKMSPEQTSRLEKAVADSFIKNEDRRCILFISNSLLKDLENKENSLVMFEPNILYYLELVLGVLMIYFLFWLASAVFYYRLIIYVIFGDKT